MQTRKNASSTSRHAYLRGLLGAVIMAIALGVAAGVGDIVRERFGWPALTVQLVMGATTSILSVPAIMYLQVKRDRRPLSALGLLGFRESIRTFGLGFGITLGFAVGMAAVASLLGWLDIGGVEWPVLLGWLVTTAVYAFFYEALPEELTLRGYTYTNLNTRLSAGSSVACALALFCAVPIAANAIRLVANVASGIEGAGFRLVPEGESPATYFSMLLAFGYTLHVARLATGSLWTGIGLHVAFLLYNRQLLSGNDGDTGLVIESTTSLTLLILPVYLTLTLITLHALAYRRGGPIDWQRVASHAVHQTS